MIPLKAEGLKFKSHTLEFGRKTLIMGVLNSTPDSFYDGGRYSSLRGLVSAARQMVQDGADIIDVGGESSRPGAEPVSASEEILRVIPLIKALSSEIKIPVSIDTTKSEVAYEAVRSGAAIINDISGFCSDPLMASVVAELEVPVVVMHIRGTPGTMQRDTFYEDLMGAIEESLKNSIEKGISAGIKREFFIVDPGIGFGKSVSQNFLIIKHLNEFKKLGHPILIGPSRKSFIGEVLNLPPEERVEGTSGAVATGISNGADIIRVHDVLHMSRVARICDAIKYGVINQ